MNIVILIGRLTRDPELRFTGTGTAVTQFTLAVDRIVAAGKEKETDFINIVVWRQLAEVCNSYLSKGKQCAVEGRMQTRNYENKEGFKVYVTEVIASNVRFLESVKSENRSQQNSGNSSNQDPFKDEGQIIDISDDDLPY